MSRQSDTVSRPSDTPSRPTALRWRLLRSAAFTAVATQLAAFGHVVGGGGNPDIAILVIGAATVGATCSGLTMRQRGWSGIFGVMLACQLGFHLLFTVDAHAMAAAQTFMPADPGRMLTFHVLAAAVSALVLARGEAALFGLLGALRRAVSVLRPPAAVDLPPQWTVSFAPLSCPRAVGALLSTSPRRGPPVARY